MFLSPHRLSIINTGYILMSSNKIQSSPVLQESEFTASLEEQAQSCFCMARIVIGPLQAPIVG